MVEKRRECICGQTALKNSKSLLILSSRKREVAVFFHLYHVILLLGAKHQDQVLLCDNCGQSRCLWTSLITLATIYET